MIPRNAITKSEAREFARLLMAYNIGFICVPFVDTDLFEFKCVSRKISETDYRRFDELLDRVLEIDRP